MIRRKREPCDCCGSRPTCAPIARSPKENPERKNLQLIRAGQGCPVGRQESFADINQPGEWIRQNQFANGARLPFRASRGLRGRPVGPGETGTGARSVACAGLSSSLTSRAAPAKPSISSAVSFRVLVAFALPTPPPSPATESYERVIVLRDPVSETTIAEGGGAGCLRIRTISPATAIRQIGRNVVSIT